MLTSPKIGDKAPDFSLPNQEGLEVSLKNFKGDWLVLYFYPRDNTSGCTTEGLAFSEKLPSFRRLKTHVLGASADSVKSHQKFCSTKNLKVQLISDENKTLLNDYGVWRKKTNYGREYLGIVRSTFIIDPKQRIAAIWDNVRVKGHVDEVYDELKKLRKN
jgi:peroxiredoxin Q/BCP